MQKQQIKNFVLLILCYVAIIVNNSSFAQNYHKEVGLYFVQNYNSKEYKGHSQVFGITKDTNNIVYFTGDGITEYDGKKWRKIPCSNQVITAIATGVDNKVYVGGTNELGYLSLDSLGNHIFKSLLPLLEKNEHTFGEIRRIISTEKFILFASKATILKYDFNSQNITSTKFDERVTLLNCIDDTIYIHIKGKGICYLKNEQVIPTESGSYFKNMTIAALLKHQSGVLLVCSKDQGLFFLKQDGVSPFYTEADFLLKEWILFAQQLSNGYYVLSAVNDGLIFLDKNGKLIQHLTNKQGLADNIVLGIHHDTTGDLWIATNGGISQISIPSSTSKFALDHGGVSINVESIKRYKSRFYAASGNMNGLLYLDTDYLAFKSVKNSPIDQFFGLFIADQNLLGAGGTGAGGIGIYQIDEDIAIPLYENKATSTYVMSGHQSLLTEDFVFLGLNNGFASLRKVNGSWTFTDKLNGFPDNIDVRSLTESNPGEIWVETYSQGIWRIKYQLSKNENTIEVLDVASFSHSKDGSKLSNMSITSLNAQQLFTGAGGIYGYNQQENILVAEEKFSMPVEKTNIKKCLLTPRNKEEIYAYFLTKEGEPHFGIFTKNKSGQYSFSDSLFRKIPTEELLNIYEIYPDSNNIVWLGGQDGLLRYDHGITESYILPPVCFREISIGKDSTIYLGHGDINISEIDYGNNSLQFEYIIPNVSVNHTASYQYRLLGYDDAWSDWTVKTERTYTNLSEGNYTFQVRGKTRYASTDEIASYSFTILPPWWRTWWAYSVYIIIIVFGLFWFSNWRNKQLRRKSELLKKLVNQKTKQLANRIEELSAINSIQKDLVAQTDEDKVCTLVGDKVQELFHADQAYISIKDSSTEEFYFPYVHQLSKEEKEHYLSLSISRPEISHEQDVDGNYSIELPIKSGQDIIGVLGLKSKEGLEEDDWNLLNNITNQLGTALHNIYLYKTAEEARIVAEEANEAKSTFLSTVSHELRTPLTSIIGFAKIIKKRFEGRILPFVQVEERKTEKAIRQVSENLDVVVSEGERLTTLINSVLDLAKIEAGCLEWNLEETDIDSVIIQATAATSALFDSKPVELILDIEDELPFVNIDKDRIIQVLINLISNAVKFTDEGQISISAKERKGSIIVSVKDSGIGIAQEDVSKVFDKFKQVGNTLTDKPKGTGLGLPICKEIVEYHEGKLWAESAIGKGSTFYFSIPYMQHLDEQQEKHVELEEKVTPVVSVNSAESYILIVDDEVSIRSLMRQEISEFDYQIKEAGNGIEALDLITQHKPDLIISDIVMPKMNGIELIKTIKADDDYKDIPILVVSITDGTQKLFDLGISQHLTKPIDIGRLMEEIKILLPNSQLVS